MHVKGLCESGLTVITSVKGRGYAVSGICLLHLSVYRFFVNITTSSEPIFVKSCMTMRYCSGKSF